jgi:hypothetical protein
MHAAGCTHRRCRSEHDVRLQQRAPDPARTARVEKDSHPKQPVEHEHDEAIETRPRMRRLKVSRVFVGFPHRRHAHRADQHSDGLESCVDTLDRAV